MESTAACWPPSVTSQPLERPEIRWAVSDRASATAYGQMVIRIGCGTDRPVRPRRPVAEPLDVLRPGPAHASDSEE